MERNPHLVRWMTVYSDKSEGSLGVRCISTFNRSWIVEGN